ncbi:vacuolar protein sorting-associated protein 8 homolog isoform X1 [Brienomyrus brachyistius]|uniref:vacuolar protein sorting-associated protein 8 homolog isoform X1 n=1 Tax=Brienomyrus brachyistius TaxID=42636 RepID=UPI0020B30CA1|nr:vacuolar protein sorting-associated protein 8 homolog isoform X1 [Brienomyrus brachyistius]
MSRIDEELRLVLGTDLPEVLELDDQEFQIPQVEDVPTLESILDENAALDDEASFLLPDDFTIPTLDAEAKAAAKQESDEELLEEEHGVMPPSHSQWVRDPLLPVVSQDPVLQINTLRGVSAQVVSAVGRYDGGRTSALAVCGIIAVGTTTGQLLIFDASQVLKLCLGSPALGAQHGPVSALGFNSDSTCILCAFTKGQILQWDVESGKLLRSISGVVPAGNAVLAVKFTSDPTVAVCSDSAGSVFELYFKRSLGARTWDSRCLFSCEKGTVRCISPLCLREDFSAHPAAQCLLLAMVSFRKLLIVRQKPELRVIYASKAHADCVPSLSWRLLTFRDSADPVLAFCQSCSFSLYQVSFAEEDLKVIKMIDYSVPFEILNFKWLSSSTLLILDTAEKLHALDRETGMELQELQLVNLQLVSTSTKPTGDQAQLKRVTYQSVCAHSGKVLLLGDKAVQVVSLKTWEERLDDLVRQDRHGDSLGLAWKFYEGSAKAVVGLPAETKLKEEVVACKVGKILLDYVEFLLRRCPDQGKIQVMEGHFQKTLPLCVTCCVKFNKTEVLFGELYEKLLDYVVAIGVLFQCLEPHIISGKLSSIPPLVMKDMVAHYTDHGMTELLDTLIPHLDVRTLDLHQVVRLSREHKLTDALIHVFNKGMNDYVTPLEELISSMTQASHAGGGDEHVKVGNKVLVYISCCLSGKAYPYGSILPPMVETVKTQVFTCLTKVWVKDVEASEGPYLLIRTLLQHNTKEFLNVMSLAFEDLQDKQAIEFHQRVIDILLQVMLESTGFSPSQIGSLFTFLARQLAKAKDALFVNHQLFHQALDFLCNPADTTQQAERQQALLDLLSAGGAAYFEESKLLSMAEAVQFYQVCEFLYEQKRLYHQILACYLKDPARKGETLQYLDDVMSSGELTDEQKVLLQNEIICNLQELLSLDPSLTASLVLRHLEGSVPLILEVLQQNTKSLFDFLHGLFNPRVDLWPFKASSLLDHTYHEKYLDLLCQTEPDCVMDFLKLSDTYRPEEAVEITRKHKVHDALAYLLEKQGKTEASFSVLMECVKVSLQNSSCPDLADREGSLGEETNPFQEVQSVLRDVMAFLQRVSGTLDSKQRDDLWFSLLSFLLSPAERIQCPLSADVERGIKNLTKEVIESMTSYIPLMDILQQLMQDSLHNVGSYGEVKTLISGIIDAYVYEKTLMEAASSLFSQDLHWYLCSLRSAVSRGLAPSHQRCGVCTQRYSWGGGNSQARLVVFSCGHVYHYGCLQNSLRQQEAQAPEWACLKCQSPKRKWFPITAEKAEQESELTELDRAQIAASDSLKRAFKNPSRISILMELTGREMPGRDSFKQKPGIFQPGIKELPEFKLNLAPPPLID